MDVFMSVWDVPDTISPAILLLEVASPSALRQLGKFLSFLFLQCIPYCFRQCWCQRFRTGFWGWYYTSRITFSQNMLCGSSASVLVTVSSWYNQVFIFKMGEKRRIQKTGKYTLMSIKLVSSHLEACWGENSGNNCKSRDVLTFIIRVLLVRLSALY